MNLFLPVLLLLLSEWPAMAQQSFPETGVEGATLKETHLLEGTVYHVQGIALDRDSIWVTSVDAANRKGYLHKFDRKTYKLEKSIDVTDGPRFHPGGFSVEENAIWVPVAEYTPHSSTVLEEMDKRSLTVKRKIAVADSLGCVAVSKTELVAGNWDSRQLYVFDKSGRQIRIVDNPEQNKYQDMKFVDGKLVASGVFTKTSGAVDWLGWPSLKLARRLHVGKDDHGVLLTREAMDLVGNNLYLMPEDGPTRLFHFVLNQR
jgi:hypothetical protein